MQEDAVSNHFEEHLDQEDHCKDLIHCHKREKKGLGLATRMLLVGAALAIQPVPIFVVGILRTVDELNLARCEAPAVYDPRGRGTLLISGDNTIAWTFNHECEGRDEDTAQDGVVEECMTHYQGYDDAYWIRSRDEAKRLVVRDGHLTSVKVDHVIWRVPNNAACERRQVLQNLDSLLVHHLVMRWLIRSRPPKHPGRRPPKHPANPVHRSAACTLHLLLLCFGSLVVLIEALQQDGYEEIHDDVVAKNNDRYGE
mmetsp:Transcript_33427/g.84459  ORF Transcript_33427/g.84459 Transcript_33427/m.84459 type:complete len:255 (+) Transcript_33427:2259-3023(+)